jgi:hypothetical protein
MFNPSFHPATRSHIPPYPPLGSLSVLVLIMDYAILAKRRYYAVLTKRRKAETVIMRSCR